MIKLIFTHTLMAIGNNCLMAFFLLFLYFFLTISLSFGADTISTNKSLSGDETLLSSGGNFELGFFKPGNSSSFYIGMWYKKVSHQTIVWVANRETPVSDKYSSELKILDGNLVLFNESKIPIWTTNVTTTTTSNSVQAVLLDVGNLVLKDGLNSDFPIWQSFDHPTHAWLPGGKIGYNKHTNTMQSITSWKNQEDPATGLFSLEPEPNGTQYFIMWNKTIQYWTSGRWDIDGKRFSLIPEMRLNYIFNFSFVSNENESYFTYSLYNPSIISRLIIDVLGQVQMLSWLEQSKQWNVFWGQPRVQCQIYSLCGAFGTCNHNSLPFCDCLPRFKPKSESEWNLDDHSGGCVRITSLQCGNTSNANGEKDRFLMTSHLGVPASSQFLPLRNATDCKSICLSNCSCTAYAFDSTGCSIWNGELLNLQKQSENDGTGKTIYIRLASSDDLFSNHSKGIVVHAVVGTVVGVVILFALVMIVLVWRRQRRLVGAIKTIGDSLVAFRFVDLQIATKNFSEKLGSGDFGSVYKGMCPDKTVMAVKKLETINHADKQFRTEVSTIGTLQHVNLVRLRGFCAEGSKKLLVYDYMPKGSLDAHLFREKYDKVLDWRTRYQIALGIARGLVYLHEKCRDCIIHCDIKPENILLDDEFCPKVADFGLAKLIGRDFSRVVTTMRGTRGYLAPEWLTGVAITTKADVYSYGMMLLELVSGRRNSELCDGGKTKFFPCWAASVAREGGDVLKLLDERLDRVADKEEVTRICRVACWCIQDDENIRPSMSRVVQILEGVSHVNKPPIPRSFKLHVDNEQEPIVFFTELSSS